MIEDKLKLIPSKPGVYLLKDSRGKILYVGKAKVLKNRLRSHFKPGRGENKKHSLLMSQVRDFEIIVTDSEVEALILEANYIKEHKPKYNVNLKDDKSYPYIRITNEPYPRIFITRRIIRDGSRYFGPYTDVGAMRQIMAAVRRIFPVRTCQLKITDDTIKKKKHKVCLNYHIGRCLGPCEGFVSQEDYSRTVEQVVSFIRGNNNQLVKDLQRRMKYLADKQRYEEAARVRDEIFFISKFQSKQKVVDQSLADRDLIAVGSKGEDGCAVVFDVRDGKIVNRRHFYLEGKMKVPQDEFLASFVKQYYLRVDYVPPEIYLSSPLNEEREIRNWLTKKRGEKVELIVPKRGEKARLMEMCLRNAELLLEELKLQKSQNSNWIAPSVKALQKDLGLKKPPKRIEAFDVSDIAGQDAVASLVVFENGHPKKSEYRKFKIRTVQGIDDFRMIAEAVERRITRLLNEKQNLPDLILVDGGKGQLSAAVAVLKRLSLPNQPIIGLAKRLEEIFLPGISDPQTLPKSSLSLRLLQRVRDEAHRFAVKYHRTIRKKRNIASLLDTVPGVGERRRTALLREFGSIEKIRGATVEEIAKIQGMNHKIAEKVLEVLKRNDSGQN